MYRLIHDGEDFPLVCKNNNYTNGKIAIFLKVFNRFAICFSFLENITHMGKVIARQKQVLKRLHLASFGLPPQHIFVLS